MPEKTQDKGVRVKRAFFLCAGLLVLTCAVKWGYLDRAILALRQTFQISPGLLFASRMARLTILLCVFLLPPLAIRRSFALHNG